MKLVKILFSFLVIPLFLLIINIILVWPLFKGGYTSELGSIESVFIADARFISENFPNLSWNPYWYTGFPFHLFYTPLLPYLMVFLHFLFVKVPLESWYRILIGFFYAATPVSVYFLGRYLLKNTAAGFLSGMIFAFAPTFGYLIFELFGTGEIYQFAPWRFLTLILYGEGGHIIGLFFLPLALLFTFKTLREGALLNYLVASAFIALVALTNIIALIALAIMLIIVFLVESMGQHWLRKMSRAFLLFLYSFGLVGFWYNLSFIKASLSIGTGTLGGGFGDIYFRFLPFLFLFIPVIFLFTILTKKENWKLPLILISWITLFFASAYFWFNKEIMLLPQPNRYLLEMDMAAAIFIAWGVLLGVSKIITQKLNFVSQVGIFFLGLLCLFFPLQYWPRVWEVATKHPDITQTSEYRVASWLKNNTQGERVFATGSTAFWLNTFTDIPQIRGGNDGLASPWILHGVYQINTGENAPVGKEAKTAISWLRIFNVSYLVVNTPESTEIFHDYKSPERFSESPDLIQLVDLKRDVVFKVPLLQPSLAQVVSKTNYFNLKALKNAVDYQALQDYLLYIDNNKLPGANFVWLKNGEAKITANIGKDQGIAVQIPYNQGWQAVNGQEQIAIKKDPLGFMYLDVKTMGEVEITLVWKRTWDMWWGYFLTLVTLLGFLAYPKLEKRFKQAEKVIEEKIDKDYE